MTLKITNMNYTAEFNDKESDPYKTLTNNIKNLVSIDATFPGYQKENEKKWRVERKEKEKKKTRRVEKKFVERFN